MLRDTRSLYDKALWKLLPLELLQMGKFVDEKLLSWLSSSERERYTEMEFYLLSLTDKQVKQAGKYVRKWSLYEVCHM